MLAMVLVINLIGVEAEITSAVAAKVDVKRPATAVAHASLTSARKEPRRNARTAVEESRPSIP